MADSDDDGLQDSEDEYPFKNDFKQVWYKFDTDYDNKYIVQTKYGKDNIRAIDFEAQKIYA